MSALGVVAPDGVPEVRPGDDLVTLLLPVVELRDGDVVVVTSKVVSKAEGRIRTGSREDALPGETARVVARRGPTTIVRTHHGLTMAAAGIDASNVAPGTVVLLPEDPDASARALRSEIRRRTGINVGVVVTDTAGRAWREGQTDIAIGAAGVRVFDDLRGQADASGKPLAVTMPCVADELAGAAELVKGKAAGVPVAVVRGLGHLVGDLDLPGARSIVRPADRDMFRQGADEAYDEGYRAGFDEAQSEGVLRDA
ncbi:MAG TPA: coenzyme F420-0:L-glutamate ligase [Nocardioides sp.]